MICFTKHCSSFLLFWSEAVNFSLFFPFTNLFDSFILLTFFLGFLTSFVHIRPSVFRLYFSLNQHVWLFAFFYFSFYICLYVHIAYYLKASLLKDVDIFLEAKILYKSKCSSVCQPRLRENVIFSAPNWDIAPIFVCADSPHKWASIL